MISPLYSITIRRKRLVCKPGQPVVTEFVEETLHMQPAAQINVWKRHHPDAFVKAVLYEPQERRQGSQERRSRRRSHEKTADTPAPATTRAPKRSGSAFDLGDMITEAVAELH